MYPRGFATEEKLFRLTCAVCGETRSTEKKTTPKRARRWVIYVAINTSQSETSHWELNEPVKSGDELAAGHDWTVVISFAGPCSARRWLVEREAGVTCDEEGAAEEKREGGEGASRFEEGSLQSAVVPHPVWCSVCKYLEREREKKERGGLTDWRAESSSSAVAAAEYKSFASRRDRCCVFHWVFYLRKIYLSAAKKKKLNKKKIQALGKMDVLPMCSIFQELQIVHDTGYFSALPSLEEYWQQVNIS